MVPVAAYAPPHSSDRCIAPRRAIRRYRLCRRLDRATGRDQYHRAPSGILAVGGYRFLAQDLQGGPGGSDKRVL